MLSGPILWSGFRALIRHCQQGACIHSAHTSSGPTGKASRLCPVSLQGAALEVSNLQQCCEHGMESPCLCCCAGGGACSTQPQPPRVPDELKNKHITEVALGTQHTLAVTAEGELFAAGSTEHGRLGLASEEDFGPSADGGCTCCPTFRYPPFPLALYLLFESSSMTHLAHMSCQNV